MMQIMIPLMIPLAGLRRQSHRLPWLQFPLQVMSDHTESQPEREQRQYYKGNPTDQPVTPVTVDKKAGATARCAVVIPLFDVISFEHTTP